MIATASATLNLRYIQDPGHGWVQVPRRLARTILGADFAKITPYSYQRGDNLYLEEDQDAGLFLLAARNSGHTINLLDEHLNDEAAIRSYRSFSLRSGEAKPLISN